MLHTNHVCTLPLILIILLIFFKLWDLLQAFDTVVSTLKLHQLLSLTLTSPRFSVVFLCVLKGELVTASKAIIEKEYQPKVIVSKQGPNPFTKLTDQELEEYRREVEQKQKGTEGKGVKWMKESLYVN